MTTSNTPQNLPVTVRKGRMGQLLSSIAGTPAGWRQNRRGSFLVMVVGTLALLAVLAIVYASIGTHDSRLTAATTQRERADDVPDQIADHILSVIGDSVTSTYYDSKFGLQVNAGGAPMPVLLSRVTFDVPSTDWARRSDEPSDPATVFSPTGSVSGFLHTPDFSWTPHDQMPDSWRPTTPWLADTEPTYLDYNGAGLSDPARPYLNKRDWLHISNIAPDGRFVNLWNLRGNFSALPGFAPGQTSFNSNYLYATGNAPPNVQVTDFSEPADARVPAHLDSRQVWLFRPARPSPNVQPNQPTYDPYLFADADGDGMFDSRWQELFDARFGRNILRTDDRYRYFVATRIIDASALINVNTATDQRAEPTADEPLGLSPGDIDLRRLLTLHDQYTINSAGYDLIEQGSAAPTDAANYELLTRDEAFNTGIYAYDALRIAIASGRTPPGDPLLDGPDLSTLATQLSLAPGDWDFLANPWGRTQTFRRFSTSLYNASYDSNAIFFRGGFNAPDMLELITRQGVNDPTSSSLELTLGGRADNPVDPAIPSRYSPLRSNRPLDIELMRYTALTGPEFDRTMLLFDSDVRRRITPISGARQFRTAVSEIRDLSSNPTRTIDPYALGANELRVDPKPLVSRITRADHPVTLAWPLTPAELTARQADRAARTAATNQLLTAFADSLLPRSGIPATPAEHAWASDARLTEFYGYNGPETALRIAAHMAVNFIDAFDSGGAQGEKPTVHTLYLDGSANLNFPANDPRTAAMWDRDTDANATNDLNPTTRVENEDLSPLRLLERRLAEGRPVTAPVVNIYGIEAQPFITQVATFTVYADKERLGDNEDANTYANIEGGDDFTNEDLMYRVLAFQLHNPFDQPIELGGRLNKGSYDLRQHPTEYYNVTELPRLDQEESYYYIRYGDKVYKLAELEEQVFVQLADAAAAHAQNQPAFGDPEVDAANPITQEFYIPRSGRTRNLDPIVLKPITIPAGQSVVVYSLSDAPRQVIERMSTLGSGAGSYANTTVPTTSRMVKDIRGYIERAIEVNLGLGATNVAGVYWVPELETAGANQGKAIIPVKHNVLPDPSTTPAGAPVELWRALRNGAEAEPVTVTMPTAFWETTVNPPNLGGAPYAFPPNNPLNDQLVDRFRIPDPAQLNRALTSGLQYEVEGSDFQDDSYLYMITLWANYSRPGNPAAASPRAPIGAIPAYCLEPKFSSGWNNSEEDDFDLGDRGPDETLFSAAGDPNFIGLANTVRAWLSNMATTRLAPISESPDELDVRITANNAGVPYNAQYPEVPLPNNNFEQSVNNSPRTLLRPADLLLPLGIGPEEKFLNASGTLETDNELRWTTLGEALAMSLGYQTAPATGVDASQPYYLPNGLFDTRLLDRGHLRLDQFAPFIDRNGNLLFDGNDERVGLQIPMALNILDTFTINPVDPDGGAWESLKRAMPGMLNINTAPLANIRAGLSTLSPPPAADYLGAPWWWGANSAYDDRIDIAASIFGFRNKQDAYLTLTAANFANFGPVISFADSVEPDEAHNLLDGRSSYAQITALGEQPGFRSPAALQTVRYRTTLTATLGVYPADWGYRTNMDFLGFDAEATNDPGFTPPASVPYGAGASGRIGIDSVLYENPDNSAGQPDRIPSNIPNSYKEQLAMINTILPSVSTRSDYFIVYFLVHGYQKSDCDVGADDPLLPSIARRFVMVVDRSKVTRRGDKPEVILFKEVPVDPMMK
jgi:hypothetical protein